MMRKAVIIIFLMILSMLVACGQEGVSSKEPENIEQAANDAEVERQEEPEDEVTEEVDTESSEEASTGSASGVKEVIQKSADAMKTVKGMKIDGKSETVTDIMGVKDQETTEMRGEMTLDPFAQHMKMDSKSEQSVTSEVEMYWTNEAVYIFDYESSQWLSISGDQAGGMMNLVPAINETQYEYFGNHYELFELKEEDDHYVVSLSSSGEQFKEVMYSALKEIAGESAYQSLTNMISEISGSYELKINKQTYYVTSILMDTEQTNSFGGTQVHSKDYTYYEYSAFNEVDEIVVPAEVVEKAQELNMNMMPQSE
ncbi:DUF6612 family protein [Virgibacillus sp. W0430]|uniref:DUF6612 family protein n=1 Tax=Virgibacillus sp. W0430 TaxID=3391580 RepID=UPI003F44F6B8